ncbi:hypothetical protein G7085_06985 [Tessaracoccus sp. HDW20]|uniref:hypothetical protein n=1 Tax=Tessaracoccus coleopterorum TaxID=2714950 RepID=UPI0018D3D9B8|nr:hypothetical protein [Tessaracoccus coleopterorum]NHB84436.1 hypothetical protein [Tessaracoccus coleopterorum]
MLTRGPGDSGITAVAAAGPSLRALTPPNRQQAVRLGEELVVDGAQLTGPGTVFRFTSLLPDGPPPSNSPGARPPRRAGRPGGRQGPGAGRRRRRARPLGPGFLSVAAAVSRPDIPVLISNEVTAAIARRSRWLPTWRRDPPPSAPPSPSPAPRGSGPGNGCCCCSVAARSPRRRWSTRRRATRPSRPRPPPSPSRCPTCRRAPTPSGCASTGSTASRRSTPATRRCRRSIPAAGAGAMTGYEAFLAANDRFLAEALTWLRERLESAAEPTIPAPQPAAGRAEPRAIFGRRTAPHRATPLPARNPCRCPRVPPPRPTATSTSRRCWSSSPTGRA